MSEITSAILGKLDARFADCFNGFYTKAKCRESAYFVRQVREEAGRIAFFDLDHELSTAEVREILEAFFA